MITRSELQRISQDHHLDGRMVSLYLPLAQDSTDVDHNITLKNVLRDAEERYEREHGQAIPDDIEAVLEEVRVVVRDDAGRYGHGMALFASPENGVSRILTVPGTVEPYAVISERPHLAPLIRLVEDYALYCTCIVSRDHARLFVGWYDEITECATLDDDEVPGQHERGGWSQARFERHIEDHVHRHFKQVAARLFEMLNNNDYRQLILGGPDEVVAGFRDGLHPYVQERVIGEVRLLMEANINEIRTQSMRVFEDWLTRQKGETIAKLREEALGNDLGVEGLNDTLAALQRGQVLGVIIDRQLRSPGVLCGHCGGLGIAPSAEGACPYCGSDVEEVDNVIPVLITKAFQQGAQVSVIDDEGQRDELAKSGGIGALLRYRLGQQAS